MASAIDEKSDEGLGAGNKSLRREKEGGSAPEGKGGRKGNPRTSTNARSCWRQEDGEPGGLDVLWAIDGANGNRRNGRLPTGQATY